MSAHIYVRASALPKVLVKQALRRDEGHMTWISYPDCPFAGVEDFDEIQLPYPRNPQLRASLVAWLDHWNLPYAVEQLNDEGRRMKNTTPMERR